MQWFLSYSTIFAYIKIIGRVLSLTVGAVPLGCLGGGLLQLCHDLGLTRSDLDPSPSGLTLIDEVMMDQGP